MYGHIHIILKDLVLSVADAATWTKILEDAGVATSADEARILDTVVQSDDITFKLVASTCKVLQLDLDSALNTFGHHFIKFALRSGNALFLKSQGATIQAFLASVNSLHADLERDHPNARFPFIEANYDGDEDAVDMTYISKRAGLKALVVGVVEEVGIRLYGMDVTFEEMPPPEDLQELRASGHSHSWRVKWRPRPGGPVPLEPVGAQAETLPKMPFPMLHSSFVELMRLFRCACDDNAAARFKCGCAGDVEGKAMAEHSPDIDDEGGPLVLSAAVLEMKKRQMISSPHDLDGVFMRATQARKVAAAWSDASLTRCRRFWENSAGRANDYALSEDAPSVDVFVSHSWSPPENWKLVMGDEIDYSSVKTTQLAVVAKDVALMKSNNLKDWGESTFWVDKACIPQDDQEMKKQCIGLIERFIKRSEHVCVLFTWSYLERLWCVYEWACVLTDKEPNQIWLQNEMFVTDRSFPLYIDCIRHFSLRRAKCYLESDRSILFEKIDACYSSHKDFEQLVKATATALMARSMAHRAGRSKRLYERFFQPCVDVARDLRFEELADALSTCKPHEWRAAAAEESSGQVESGAEMGKRMSGRQVTLSIKAGFFHDQVSDWFDTTVSPVLSKLRYSSVRSLSTEKDGRNL